eukprot:gnl/TRDRNA2_/TRDRNA2_44243_c0_seq1.p1 gnl/TRDRNA2_/TRDRNA2_44243_c0~~gnl/TRDRNA2_/TRDRNA2_44243_c0_seq1.p1  ORF type:complete len:686 (-),score=53.07 gnl/TRDRNA2_/TRDRNA2_44243_c0_seq1:25-2082(-)
MVDRPALLSAANLARVPGRRCCRDLPVVNISLCIILLTSCDVNAFDDNHMGDFTSVVRTSPANAIVSTTTRQKYTDFDSTSLMRLSHRERPEASDSGKAAQQGGAATASDASDSGGDAQQGGDAPADDASDSSGDAPPDASESGGDAVQEAAAKELEAASHQEEDREEDAPPPGADAETEDNAAKDLEAAAAEGGVGGGPVPGDTGYRETNGKTFGILRPVLRDNDVGTEEMVRRAGLEIKGIRDKLEAGVQAEMVAVCPCTFPFIYNGVAYYSCTMAEWTAQWCGTTTVVTRGQPQGWTYCTIHCPGWQHSASTIQWCPCRFPFTFMGEEYNECISRGGTSLWCGTRPTVLPGSMEGWSLCSNTCPGWSNTPSAFKTTIPRQVFAPGYTACPCYFPFSWHGTSFNTCTDAGASTLWCGIVPQVEDGSNSWTLCTKTCPGWYEQVVKMTNGCPCYFPFVYRGVSYRSCTYASFGMLWCGTRAYVQPGSPNDWVPCTDPCLAQDTPPVMDGNLMHYSQVYAAGPSSNINVQPDIVRVTRQVGTSPVVDGNEVLPAQQVIPQSQRYPPQVGPAVNAALSGSDSAMGGYIPQQYDYGIRDGAEAGGLSSAQSAPALGLAGDYLNTPVQAAVASRARLANKGYFNLPGPSMRTHAPAFSGDEEEPPASDQSLTMGVPPNSVTIKIGVNR